MRWECRKSCLHSKRQVKRTRQLRWQNSHSESAKNWVTNYIKKRPAALDTASAPSTMGTFTWNRASTTNYYSGLRTFPSPKTGLVVRTRLIRKPISENCTHTYKFINHTDIHNLFLTLGNNFQNWVKIHPWGAHKPESAQFWRLRPHSLSRK